MSGNTPNGCSAVAPKGAQDVCEELKTLMKCKSCILMSGHTREGLCQDTKECQVLLYGKGMDLHHNETVVAYKSAEFLRNMTTIKYKRCRALVCDNIA